MSSRRSHFFTPIFILALLTLTHSSHGFENAHCLNVLKELEQQRNELRPPKSSSLDIFTRDEFVQVGDGTESGLQGVRSSALTQTPVALPLHPHHFLLGTYEHVILPEFHAVTLTEVSSSAERIVTPLSLLVPHAQLFPLLTGSKEVVRQTLKKLLEYPLPVHEGEVVRFRSPEGPMMVGVVEAIAGNILTIVSPNGTPIFLPDHHVFKMLTSGNGSDLIVLPPQIMIPPVLSVADVVSKPNFELLKDQHPTWSDIDFFPVREEAAEALLDGAAKFTSLTHFLKQKPETQLEWLLAFYRLFMKPHPMAQDLPHFGIRDIEMFTRIGVSDAVQDLALLGTLLIETGYSVKAVLLPMSGRSLKLWFEVTLPGPPLHSFDTPTFIVDPNPPIKVTLASPFVLPYADTKAQAHEDPDSDAAWIYFNPDRLTFPL